jgi:hypothetical protein
MTAKPSVYVVELLERADPQGEREDVRVLCVCGLALAHPDA